MQKPPSGDEVRRGQQYIRENYDPKRDCQIVFRGVLTCAEIQLCLKLCPTHAGVPSVGAMVPIREGDELILGVGDSVVALTEEERLVVLQAVQTGGALPAGVEPCIVRSLAKKGALWIDPDTL